MASINKDDEALASILQKIDREKALIKGANGMRQQSNEVVKARLDVTIRDARKNLQYFEERLRELQMKKNGNKTRPNFTKLGMRHSSVLSLQCS